MIRWSGDWLFGLHSTSNLFSLNWPVLDFITLFSVLVSDKMLDAHPTSFSFHSGHRLHFPAENFVEDARPLGDSRTMGWKEPGFLKDCKE